MVAWIIPALKAVLPHVGAILSAAMPVFTKKNTDVDADRALLQQQIAELQAATAQNSAHIKELAAQLQSTVTALEEAAAITADKARRVLVFNIVAVILSMAAFAVSLYFLLREYAFG